MSSRLVPARTMLGGSRSRRCRRPRLTAGVIGAGRRPRWWRARHCRQRPSRLSLLVPRSTGGVRVPWRPRRGPRRCGSPTSLCRPTGSGRRRTAATTCRRVVSRSSRPTSCTPPRRSQLPGVLDTFYADVPDVVLLVLDVQRLEHEGASVVWERVDGADGPSPTSTGSCPSSRSSTGSGWRTCRASRGPSRTWRDTASRS